ncbi:unnamed protein product [Blepharisma stoltei]|uniref:Uncharacterized protein n=1 Tax=Blepharisma stoltei TaxID=1481888 RepID=A0AAU9IIV0_9CILI|nr:unnamed protein product [Blepharisma stoltei]
MIRSKSLCSPRIVSSALPTERKNIKTAQKVYIWESSIPQEWKQNKSVKLELIHVSQTNKNKNTLDFLVETQKYINKICGRSLDQIRNNQLISPLLNLAIEKSGTSNIPRRKRKSTTQNMSILAEGSKGLFISELSPPKTNTLASKSYLSPRSISFQKLASKSQIITTKKQPIPLIVNQLGTDFLHRVNSEQHIIHSYSIPNGFKLQKPSTSNSILLSPRSQDEQMGTFLNRFENSNRVPYKVPRSREGVNGWKLSARRTRGKRENTVSSIYRKMKSSSERLIHTANQ